MRQGLGGASASDGNTPGQWLPVPVRGEGGEERSSGKGVEDAPMGTYVPILKGKLGERTALGALKATAKSNMEPLIEVPPPTTAEGAVPEHRTAVMKSLSETWGAGALSLDGHRLRHDARYNPDDAAALRTAATNAGLAARLVVCFNDEEDVWSASAGHGESVTLRATPEDLVQADAVDRLRRRMRAADLDPGRVHLVIDAGAIDLGAEAQAATRFHAALSAVPGLPEWASITAAAGAFPKMLSAATPHGRSELPRSDFIAARIASQRAPRGLVLRVGDYATVNPNWAPITDERHPPSANIRYAFGDKWVIYRGHSVLNDKHGGFGQFNALARQLRKDAAFGGTAYSWADARIAHYAKADQTGNSTTWVAVAVNRHLTHAAHQVA
jgi:hypothetical protein